MEITGDAMSSERRFRDLGDIRVAVYVSEDGSISPALSVSAMDGLSINELDALNKLASAAAEKLKQLADGARYE